MSKLNWPGTGSPYRGFISEMRTWFQIIASWAENSPKSAADVNAHIAVLAAATGYAPALPEDQAIVEDGDTFPDGDYLVTAAVEDNVATMSVAPNAGFALVEDDQVLTDGDYEVTLHVAAGVVTCTVIDNA